MIPQIVKRKIGNVTFVDVRGSLVGSWALRGKEEFSRICASEDSKRMILNLRETTGIDTLGAKSMMESIPQDASLGILGGSSSILEMVERFSNARNIRTFQNEEEIISTFGEDLVGFSGSTDQRKLPRLQTALPIKFYYEDGEDQIHFHAVVTNLSETGLFAEYIDVQMAERSLEQLNPYDLKLLHLSFALPRSGVLEAEGKVIHRKLDGDQVGIGIQFYQVSQSAQEQIRRFLKQNGA